jgi:hypothetical protein
MKMEAICSSETSVDFQWVTQRHIPEESKWSGSLGLRWWSLHALAALTPISVGGEARWCPSALGTLSGIVSLSPLYLSYHRLYLVTFAYLPQFTPVSGKLKSPVTYPASPGLSGVMKLWAVYHSCTFERLYGGKVVNKACGWNRMCNVCYTVERETSKCETVWSGRYQHCCI